MLTRDVMAIQVVTVGPEEPVGAIARLLVAQRISAVPVVDAEGALLGLVTEADLIHRLAAAGQPREGWLAGMLARPDDRAAAYSRLHGRTARDTMTTGLVTATPETPVEEAARLMEANRVKRLPVLREGRLVGLVARADLLRALLEPGLAAEGSADDRLIRAGILSAMREQPWADTLMTWPEVEGGAVTFYGFCRSPEVRRALRVLAENQAGVTQVEMRTEVMPAIPFGVS